MEPSASAPANTYSQRLLDSSAEDLFGIGTQATPRDEEPGFFSSVGSGIQQIPFKLIDDYSRTFEDLSGDVPGVDEPVDLPQILSPEEMKIGTPGELTRDIGAFAASFVGGGVVLKGFQWFNRLSKGEPDHFLTNYAKFYCHYLLHHLNKVVHILEQEELFPF